MPNKRYRKTDEKIKMSVRFLPGARNTGHNFTLKIIVREKPKGKSSYRFDFYQGRGVLDTTLRCK